MKTLLNASFILMILLIIGCTGKKPEPVSSAQTDSVLKTAQSFFGVLPSEVQNPSNTITPEKVLLGKTLFYDTRLSAKGNNSCNDCHNLTTYGVEHSSKSRGDEGMDGSRNSPTVLNAALHFVQFWDGRAKDVEEQAGGPILNPVEMNIHSKEFLENRLDSIQGYRQLFAAAFPDAAKPVTFENVQLAIAAFERTLLTPSRFDTYLNGETSALDEQEKRGLDLFIKTGCASCHSGVLLGGSMFQKAGLFADYHTLPGSNPKDKGRFEVTQAVADTDIFKVPSLRNIAETYPYFHDGAMEDLPDAIEAMANLQLNKNLSEEEVEDMVAFLKSLTGKIPEDALMVPVMP
ncbi:MAG TPA: cytochrome c peroxidase [Bacteroidales bacterium]|nr:cytochrome c peroxidase [Bacteroidales bacterium]HRZ21128.1 cytochrome c peroxidase [Bacteroidales bacterium]